MPLCGSSEAHLPFKCVDRASSSRQYSWDEFMGMWNVMDGMALSISRE